jgi:HD-GYP domain-containing protein (c-di-GMP phosphodiesterase class II)
MRQSPNIEDRNDQVRSLLASLDNRVPGEAAHASRVAVMSVAVGHELGLRGEKMLQLRFASELHDIGKASLDPGPLLKILPLTSHEHAAIRAHSTLAEALVDAIDWLRPCVPAIRHHHERWDGRGYPDGIAGERIPLDSRIISVAEAFDAMTMLTFGREPLTEDEAVQELQCESGGQFDPVVVNAFLAVKPLIQPVVR